MKKSAMMTFAALVFSTMAYADLSVTGVNGVSSFSTTNLKSGATASITINGGLAGPQCTADGTNPCNSCTSTLSCVNSTLGVDEYPLCACNENRVYDSLLIKVNLQNSDTATGNAMLIYGGVPVTLKTPANGGKFVDFTWGQVCQLAGASSCESLSSVSQIPLTLGLDLNGDGLIGPDEPQFPVFVKLVEPGSAYNIFGHPNMDGVGSFQLGPGDGRIYLLNVMSSIGFPLMSYGASVAAVRVYASDKSMSEAYQGHAVANVDLGVADDGSGLKTNYIDGLNNGTPYYVRLALVDQAANIVQYYPDLLSLPSNCLAGTADPASCPYAATPGPTPGK